MTDKYCSSRPLVVFLSVVRQPTTETEERCRCRRFFVEMFCLCCFIIPTVQVLYVDFSIWRQHFFICVMSLRIVRANSHDKF